MKLSHDFKAIYLRDFIDFDSVEISLQKNFPSCSLDKISQAFEKFFWADERSDFWYYSVEQCILEIEEMKAEFVASEAGESVRAGEVAIALGTELIGKPFGFSGWATR